MLKAYVRRCNGETTPVEWQHSGQRIGLGEGRVRRAHLVWEKDTSLTEQPQAALRRTQAEDLLLGSVPLLDVLILTRADAQGERVVFHGLLTDCTTDGAVVNVWAVDDPAVQRVFDQPFEQAGALLASDRRPEAAVEQTRALSVVPQETLTGHPSGQPQYPEADPDAVQTQVTPQVGWLGGLPPMSGAGNIQVRRLGDTGPIGAPENPPARAGGRPGGKAWAEKRASR